uniref:SBP-type domain-containing protein n=1 Tax=Ananas comosus var. bracteatus TaxID=296719 RepID=A0A6V7NNN1_ANACO|nr:unnamed protein product [Ananas comosus var. bracteatus]
MDWDAKLSPWDLSEFDQASDATMGSMVGGSGGGGKNCSVDLKLGGLGDFAPAAPEKWREQSAKAPPSAAPSKRARGPGGSSQAAASCLVDGCNSDLSSCRTTTAGTRSAKSTPRPPSSWSAARSRDFASSAAAEFDEVKRSCRKRLDGHNRRRRKPQPEPISPGILFSNQHQATQFSNYPPIFTAAATEPSWASIMKAEENDAIPLYPHPHHPPLQLVDRTQTIPASFSSAFKEQKRFPFLQEKDDTALPVRPALKPVPHGLAQVLDSSDCALSLLSSPPTAQNSSITNAIPMGQSMVSAVHYGGSGDFSASGFSCDENAGSVVLVPDAGGSELQHHCQAMFHGGGGGRGGKGPQMVTLKLFPSCGSD